MWQEILGALALVMVIEGILPSLNPRAFRRTMHMMTEMDDRFLRTWGLSIMTIGAVLLYFVKS
ncbi:MAG: DUF2065 domain-containing protein [Gammaproteobacteria bacterium]|nr:DUF2065 domain-containing protein [Gammaproteobacteria bacterium]MDH5651014.1 DUF2065 domain-containing protein [Gammaproteobacteria bacterium]